MKRRMLGVAAIVGSSCAAGLLLQTSCRPLDPPPPRDLVDAARVIEEMLSYRRLEAAGFYDAYPDPRPSDFVSYINSDLGVMLWPPREGSPFTDPFEMEASRSIGETVIPKGIAYRRNRCDPEGGRQIIYRADDESGEVVVEAYADPSVEPVLTRRWKLPR